MLILSRKSGESVVIGDHNRFSRLLKVTVTEITPGRVTLGFDVDENVPIQCERAWERILTPATGATKPSMRKAIAARRARAGRPFAADGRPAALS